MRNCSVTVSLLRFLLNWRREVLELLMKEFVETSNRKCELKRKYVSRSEETKSIRKNAPKYSTKYFTVERRGRGMLSNRGSRGE